MRRILSPVGSLSLVVVLVVSDGVELVILLLIALLTTEKASNEAQYKGPDGGRGHSDGQRLGGEVQRNGLGTRDA